jgi:hypothetical protein
VGQKLHCRSKGFSFFSTEREKQKSCTGNRFFVHRRRVSAVKRPEVVSDKMTYVVLRGRSCNSIVLSTHAAVEESRDYSKDSFCEEVRKVFYHFPNYHRKIPLHFNDKPWKEDVFNPTTGDESSHHLLKYYFTLCNQG